MPDFTDALDKARGELAKLRRERQQLDVRIAKMEQLVGALNTVHAEDDDAVEMTGITDAIRAVLKNSRVVMTPTQVRDQLKASGFDFVDRYGSNLIQSVHVVLKRLVKSDEVMEIEPGPYGDKAYWWTMNGTPQFPYGSLTDLMNLGMVPLGLEVPDFENVGQPPPAPPPSVQRRRLTPNDPDLEPPPTLAGLRRKALIDKMTEKKR